MKKKGVMLPVTIEKPARKEPEPDYLELEDDENGVTDLTESPLAREDGSASV